MTSPSEKSTNKPRTSISGIVKRIIPSTADSSEQAQISLQDSNPRYRDLYIDNNLTDPEGESVGLKPGSEVGVIVEAELKDTKSSD